MAVVSGPAPAVSLGRETCGELDVAERREWLAANGQPPMRPVGCIAQAWSVAEALRAWDLVQRARRPGSSPLPEPQPHSR